MEIYSATQFSGILPWRFIWKIKLPPRVKTFIWLVLKKSILTRDVLLKWGGKCEEKCLFSGHNESVTHLISICTLATYISNIVSSVARVNFHFTFVDHYISV